MATGLRLAIGIYKAQFWVDKTRLFAAACCSSERDHLMKQKLGVLS